MKIKTCRLCLVMDVKMFHLGSTKAKDFIARVFNLYGFNQNLNDLHFICYECRALLDKTFIFIQKMLKAQQILFDTLKEKGKVCQSDLRSLDRHKLGLNTHLRKHICGIDFNINEDETKPYYTTEKEDLFNKLCPYTGLIMKDDEDKLNKNKYFIESTPRVLPSSHTNALVNADIVILDSGDESTVKNNKPINKKNNPHCERYKVKTSNIQNQSTTVQHNNNTPVPKTEIIQSDVEEHECYVEIKTEELTDPLTNTSHNANISVESKNNNIVTNETKGNCNISPEHHSCIVKSPDTETNRDISIDIDGNLDENGPSDSKLTPNIRNKLHTPVVDSDWHPEYKPKKRKCLKKQVRQSTYVNYKRILKTSTFIDSVQEVIENEIDKKVRRKEAKYVFSDHSDEKDQVSYKKKRKKKEDNEYEPITSGESEDSLNDMFGDDGKCIKRLDNREYPMKCDHCDYEVPVRKEHYIHYLRFHKDVEYPYGNIPKFVCQFCGKKCRTATHHREHEMSHGEKTVQCTKCSRKFTSSSRMRSHVRFVHCPKLYECDYCGKTSKGRSDFILHTRIHTGEKPYKCHICGARFAHGGNRTIHIRTNHQQSIVYPKNRKRKNRKYQYTSSSTDSCEDGCVIKKRKTVKTKRKSKKNNKKPPV